MEINQEKIEREIIRQAVEQLVGDDELLAQLHTVVTARANELFEKHAESQIREAIDVSIRTGFDHEYQKVDSFGRKHGEPTTIRKELEKQISGYWNQVVDKNGNPATGYGDKLTRAEWVMSRIVADDFNAQMKQHIVNVSGGLKDGLRRSLHETVNELLSSVFKVNSIDDKVLVRTGDACIQPVAKQV